MKTPANLFIMCGLPGSGKTTVARKIAGRVNGVLFTADVVRREMFDVRTYSEEERQAVYEELLRRSAPLLAKGISVVLDATYINPSH
ncbi:AAA family ATPase [Chloroflexi bacterium TSY]|nr:AAA family ATPase [Chloroflexi bacterium TSY]